jgi:hypothetical protein
MKSVPKPARLRSTAKHEKHFADLSPAQSARYAWWLKYGTTMSTKHPLEVFLRTVLRSARTAFMYNPSCALASLSLTRFEFPVSVPRHSKIFAACYPKSVTIYVSRRHRSRQEKTDELDKSPSSTPPYICRQRFNRIRESRRRCGTPHRVNPAPSRKPAAVYRHHSSRRAQAQRISLQTLDQ